MKKILLILVILVLAGGLIYWQRLSLLGWYYVRQLTRADKESREVWVKRLAGLDVSVLPRLLGCLQEDQAGACENVAAALIHLVERWGPEDARSQDLAEDIRDRFAGFSLPGQQGSLQVAITLLRQKRSHPAPARLTQPAGDLLTLVSKNPELRGRALSLAGALVKNVPPGQWRDLCQELANQGLKDQDGDNRVQAVDLLLHLALPPDNRLLSQVVPLLRDEVAEVRRAALIAVGPIKEVVREDDLLPLLHDPDAEVRRLCEAALCSRGLRQNHIFLARLISDQRPAARLKVVDHLQQTADLAGTEVWLRRLIQDPAPAVRAAAVRAAYYHSEVDMRGRLQQMAGNDPSPTVRQIAMFYLNQPPLRQDD